MSTESKRIILEGKNMSCIIEQRSLWKNLNVSVSFGERLGIQAPSGKGKTLLLRKLAQLDPLQTGDVKLFNKEPMEWGFPNWRSRVIYLSQKPYCFGGSVRDNLQSIVNWYCLKDRIVWNEQKIIDWLLILGRERNFLSLSAKKLSGGELQILALIRALQLDPHILLLDEAFASLDSETRIKSERLINSWIAGGQRGCIVTSHDKEQIKRFCTRTQEITK